MEYTMTIKEIISKQLPNSQPVTNERIQQIQSQLRCIFPNEYVSLLSICNGGLWKNQRVLLYTIDNEELPESESLTAVNSNMTETKLLFIGKNGEEDFGYKLEGLTVNTTEIYIYNHEDETASHLANSLPELLEKLNTSEPKKKKGFFSFLFK